MRTSHNLSAVNKRLVKLEKKIDDQGKATTEEIANLTRDYILRYIPRATGESASVIGKIEKINRKGYHSITIGITRLAHPEKPLWRGRPFNLPLWMFTSPRAFGHFHTGNIALMRSVVPNMTERFYRQIILDVGKVIKEEGF